MLFYAPGNQVVGVFSKISHASKTPQQCLGNQIRVSTLFFSGTISVPYHDYAVLCFGVSVHNRSTLAILMWWKRKVRSAGKTWQRAFAFLVFYGQFARFMIRDGMPRIVW